MKKSLIAASASAVALAAMPVVGAFATDVTSTTDNLEITIEKVCSLGHEDATPSPAIDVAGVVRANGDGSWEGMPSGETSYEATVTGTAAASDTLSKTMSNGTSTTNLGTTTLGVFCNNEKGYTITTSGAANLTSTTTTDTIDIAGTISSTTSGWSYMVEAASGNRGEVKNSHGSWATSANANGIIAGSATTAPKTTTNAGDYYTVTYGVGIDNTQAAGVYTGHVTYTLDQLDS